MTVAANRAVRTARSTGDTDLHREIEHGVIVCLERPGGSQLPGNIANPTLASRLGVVGSALKPGQPTGDVVVNDDGALSLMERQPCRPRIRPHPGKLHQFSEIDWRSASPGCNDSRRLEKQRSAPMETSPRSDLAGCVRSSIHQGRRGGVLLAHLTKDAVGLRGARSLYQQFRDEGQPWI